MTVKTTHVPALPPVISERSVQAYSKKAHASLQKLRESLEKIPQAKKLLFVLKVKEACLSLKTQGLSLSLEKALFLCVAKKESKKHKKMQPILYYLKAIEWLEKQDKNKPVDISFMETLQGILEKDSLPYPQDIGHVRKRQNWIGPRGCKREDALFYPPSPEKVKPLLRSLQKYIHSSQKDPLVQLGVIIAQFLIIHPFMDGNGRVARLLIPYFIYKKNILSKPLLYLSPYLLHFRLTYIKNLHSFTRTHSWKEWLPFFLKGIDQEAKTLSYQMERIYQLYCDVTQILSSYFSARQAGRLGLFLFQVPVFTEELFRKKGLLTEKEAKTTLKMLQKKRLIRKSHEPNYFVFSLLIRKASRL